ncbi:hypothetical protein M3193_08010 [Sporosarcina luteola]|uniref:hypothetical protein n=1 Tax=Sporosarcina luteola TaxID=582850 RepID=UPI002040ED46|nr:hypothetical protein [Sporosarcina luteola]MCM3744086.1 hypothetical protein [Sporosarcina luteola]
MFRTHYIWGDYPETEELIKELQQNDDMDIITVIDPEAKNRFLKKQGNITYASSNYVEDARNRLMIEFHYYYIPPSERIDGAAWHVNSGESGLLQ